MTKYLTCDEVANRYNVKKSTVWRWIRGKQIVAVRINKAYLIRPSDLEEFEKQRMTM